MTSPFLKIAIALLIGAIFLGCATAAHKYSVASQCPFGQYSLDEIRLKAIILGEARRAVFVSTDGTTVELHEGETISRECATIAPIGPDPFNADHVVLLLKNGEKKNLKLPVVSIDAESNEKSLTW